MTREQETIEILKAYRKKLSDSVSNQLEGDIEAFEMAIKALEQEPCDKYIKEIDHLRKYIYKLETQIVEQEPCEDAISRQAAIDKIEKLQMSIMRSESLIDQCKFEGLGMAREVLIELPSVSTGNPNNCDLISREWLKTAIHNFYYGLTHTPTEEDIQAYIDAAPSVSTGKTRQWIPVSERLPEKNMECLVSVGDFYLTQTAMYSNLMGIKTHRIFYQGEVGYDNFKDITEYVKAWMPLPEPYREDGDAD